MDNTRLSASMVKYLIEKTHFFRVQYATEVSETFNGQNTYFYNDQYATEYETFDRQTILYDVEYAIEDKSRILTARQKMKQLVYSVQYTEDEVLNGQHTYLQRPMRETKLILLWTQLSYIIFLI